MDISYFQIYFVDNRFIQGVNYTILLALDAILGHKSAHSFATGPVIADPFISPLLLTITPALSSKYMNVPSFLRNGFCCHITTTGITVTVRVHFKIPRKRQFPRGKHKRVINLPFFLSSGFPFFTVAMIISPDPAAGRQFNRPLIPCTAMTYKFLAPKIQ